MSHDTDQLNHLIKMVNQIAANQPVELIGEEAAVNAVAGHIQKFWAPPMRERIGHYLAEGGEKLSLVAKKAVERI
ncbi:formate dehydrogenase subunit delta [Porticoccaceae bacterium LTM1]|nr:formate dehydrogenase subunit delta [Porticoccaceae bacterium LTM1]